MNTLPGRNPDVYLDEATEPVELDDGQIKQLLENFARQSLIVNAAREELDRIVEVIRIAFGERKRAVFSENAVVTRQKGSRSYEWQQAAMIHGIPTERYPVYARPPSIDWRKMCLDEGVNQEDVPFTRKPDKIKIKMATLEEAK